MLERNVSLRRLFSAPKSHVSTGGKDINFMFIFVVVYLGLSISRLQCKLAICNVMLLLNCKGGLLLILLLLIVTPIVGFCNCLMFCCVLLCVHSSFTIISGCFALFVLLASHCCVAFPHNAIGLLWYFLIIHTIFGETANWLPISYCL